jgi:hypothetical protein
MKTQKGIIRVSLFGIRFGIANNEKRATNDEPRATTLVLRPVRQSFSVGGSLGKGWKTQKKVILVKQNEPTL